MTRLALITAVMACAIQAQDPAAPGLATNAAISGIVRDKGTGKPLADYTLSVQVNANYLGNTILMNSQTKEVKSTTDESGHYRLGDLPPAPYRVTARDSHNFSTTVTKFVTVNGHDLDNLNFDVVVDGTIQGKVVDENKEPISGITVFLVSREYFLGSSGYFLREASRPTNDRGEYTLQRVQAGQTYYLVAEKRAQKLAAHSDVPLNPKLRRRVPLRTWYLNSPSKDGAAGVMVRPGEVREGVDIEMKKSPSFCAEGTLQTAGGPGAINFSIEAQQPSSGVHEGGGMFMVTGNGVTGSDGAFRLCDLYPGTFRLQASLTKGDLSFGVAQIAIADEDVKGLKITALPAQPMEVEVTLDGPIPDPPLASKVNVSLTPLLRTIVQGERNGGSVTQIPGTLTMPAVIADDYSVRVIINTPGLYLKDVTYAGHSVRFEPLRMGMAPATSGMRVIVGQDGAKLSAQVTTKDGVPAGDVKIVVMPAVISSQGMLAASLVTSQTDQNGNYTSQTLAPGKYYIAAIDGTVDYTSESIDRLWLSKSRFTEVDLSPKGNAQVTLQPMQLLQ